MVPEREPAAVADRPRRSVRVPTVGLALGAGLLVGEFFGQVRGILTSFSGRGMWVELLMILAIYAAIGGALDLLVQRLWPRSWSGRTRWLAVARGAPVLILGAGLHLEFGVHALLPLSTVPVAVVVALAAHLRWGWPVAAAITAWTLWPALPATATATTTPLSATPASGPSFAVIVLDTVRRDHTSAYGYRRDTTPNLAALAKRGVRFDRAYTTGCWSIPTHASLFTGLVPIHHGAHYEHMRLENDVPTLAEVLARDGYETAAFTPNPYVAVGTGLTRGFTRVEESWRTNILREFLVAGQVSGRLGLRTRDKGGAGVVASVRRWLGRRDPKRPYFLFVNLLEAHAPYHEVPARFRRAFVPEGVAAGRVEEVGRASDSAQWMGKVVAEQDIPLLADLLDGATACADHYLGQILEAVGEDTVVVVLSDHGEALGEHGLFGHMSGLYEPLIRVPLVMAGPALPRGRVVPDLVSIVDVMPTILGWAGIEAPRGDGVDLRPVMAGERSLADRVVAAWQFRADRATQLWVMNRSAAELAVMRARKAAAVKGDAKRIVAQGGTDWGFDLAADPGEERPFPGPVTRLAVAVPRPGRKALEPVEALDPAQKEALRSLGYVH